jgi:hypothetical protein
MMVKRLVSEYKPGHKYNPLCEGQYMVAASLEMDIPTSGTIFLKMAVKTNRRAHCKILLCAKRVNQFMNCILYALC